MLKILSPHSLCHYCSLPQCLFPLLPSGTNLDCVSLIRFNAMCDSCWTRKDGRKRRRRRRALLSVTVVVVAAVVQTPDWLFIFFCCSGCRNWRCAGRNTTSWLLSSSSGSATMSWSSRSGSSPPALRRLRWGDTRSRRGIRWELCLCYMSICIVQNLKCKMVWFPWIVCFTFNKINL